MTREKNMVVFVPMCANDFQLLTPQSRNRTSSLTKKHWFHMFPECHPPAYTHSTYISKQKENYAEAQKPGTIGIN